MDTAFVVKPMCWITNPFLPSTYDNQCQQCGRLIPHSFHDDDNDVQEESLVTKEEEEVEGSQMDANDTNDDKYECDVVGGGPIGRRSGGSIVDKKAKEEKEKMNDGFGGDTNTTNKKNKSSRKKTKKKTLQEKCKCTCGAMYCSRTCYKKDQEIGSYNHIMCVGPHDETHVTYQFKVLALESGPNMYSTIVLASQLWIISSNNNGQHHHHHSSSIQRQEQKQQQQHNNKDRSTLDDGTIFEDNPSSNNIIIRSYELFVEILQRYHEGRGIDTPSIVATDDDDDDDDETEGCDDGSNEMKVLIPPLPLPTLEEWKSLLSYVSCHKVYGTTPSLLTQECQLRTKENRWDDDEKWTELVMNLVNNNNNSTDQQNDDDEDDGDNDTYSESAIGAAAVTKIELMDQPEDFFQPISWVAVLYELENDDDLSSWSSIPAAAMLPSTATTHKNGNNGIRLKHSCIPTHELSPGTSDGDMSFLQLKEIVLLEDKEESAHTDDKSDQKRRSATTSVTISRIDDRLDLESRAELLHGMGMEQENSEVQCTCARCIFERDPTMKEQKDQHVEVCGNTTRTPSMVVSKKDLYRLLNLAKIQGRYDDAMDVAEALVQIDPDDFKAHFQRARIAGWQGDYSRREELLNEANSLAMEHNLIHDVKYDAIRTALVEANAYYRKESFGGCHEGDVKPHIQRWRAPFAVDGIEGENHESEGRSEDYDDGDDENGMEDSVFVGEGILDAKDCSRIVSAIEERTQRIAWTTSRHYAIPTTDIPVYQLPELLPWFNKQLQHTIFPAMRSQFNIPSNNRLRILDAFFVKYNGSGSNNRLPLHNDQSDFSLTIAMNSLQEYQGGGTYFNFVDDTVKTDIGGIISFAGHILHAGEIVTEGTRYIIVAFIYQESVGSPQRKQ